MEEIKMSPKELRMAIDNGKVLGQGMFGTVFTYKDKLIKLDKQLYSLLKGNHLSNFDWVIEHVYKYYQDDFNNRNQIEELVKRQPNVTLTKLPTGIVTLTDVNPRFMGISPGIIIPYHKDHENIKMLDAKDYKKLLTILKKLLLAVKELADNEISQEDLITMHSYRPSDYNVLYKGDTPQIIDLSGELIKTGKEFTDAKIMYYGLGNIILDYFKLNDLELPISRDDVETLEQNQYLLEELERQTRGK